MVHVKIHARDQGWGNTGYSYIRLEVVSASGEIFGEKWMILTHEWSDGDVVHELPQRFLDKTEHGSVIRIVMVSARYPGYEANVQQAGIYVWNNWRMDMILIRKTLQKYAKKSIHELFQPNKEEPDMKLCQHLAFLFAESDNLIFSEIIKFAY